MLKLLTKQGYSINVPECVDNSSTYVFLEKEEWFERELPFLMRWLQPGMQVIDVGANIGAYTLAGARAVGSSGRVYAVEPGSRPRKYLEASCRESGCGNVVVIRDAVSDFDGGGFLKGDDNETASLVESDDQQPELEEVPVARLDSLASRLGWHDVDFLKIDVEGVEHKVVAGGREYLSKNSPLIMFEFRANGVADVRARLELESLGYRMFRILGSGEYLVPAPRCEDLPKHDLNLFAVKGERLRQLEREGFLADTDQEIDAAGSEYLDLDGWLDQPFARSLDIARTDVLDSPQKKAVLNFLVSQNRKAPASVRYGALLRSWSTSLGLISQDASVCNDLIHARLASELGYVDETAFHASRAFQRISESGEASGLFIPPLRRFDNIPIEAGQEEAWFLSSLGEQLIGCLAHSTAYASAQLGALLSLVCSSCYATPEMARAMILMSSMTGELNEIRGELWRLASAGLNPEVWNPSHWIPA